MDGWTDQTGWLARPPVFKLNSAPSGIYYYWLPLLTPMQISSNNEAVMLCVSVSVN